MTMSLQCFIRRKLVVRAYKQSEVQKEWKFGSDQGSEIAPGKPSDTMFTGSGGLKNEGR